MFHHSEAAKRIRSYWKPDGKIDRENEKRIKKAMADSGVSEFSIPLFLYHEKHKGKQAEVARLLQL